MSYHTKELEYFLEFSRLHSLRKRTDVQTDVMLSSYRNHYIDLLWKLFGWFLYNKNVPTDLWNKSFFRNTDFKILETIPNFCCVSIVKISLKISLERQKSSTCKYVYLNSVTISWCYFTKACSEPNILDY